ncbi:MAG: mechanosensitive ion channel domain-containing protein, partial [Gammaproteobacteria bacterium]
TRAKRLQEAEESASPGPEEGGIGEPEVDLVAMDADSRKLLNAVILLIAALGLIAVWGEVLPALSLFEKIELWQRRALVNGIESLVPVTAGDVLMAVVVSIGGYILVANLPSLINIILLKQGSISAGGRYAVQTLTSYLIVAVAVLYVLNTLGLNASQLGFAAAALGVGIGFGLQEIVANFICGLILLFERPVRVGDVVTIGTESGVVSKIRIRATTLRDWEKKELIIPNKELITGRLLNWTLSDSVTRLFVTVGIAYGSDVEQAMDLVMQAAQENEAVLADPEPSVHFEQFGDSSLNISLRAYVGALSERLSTITALHKAIDKKFREASIVIPFPQRDVHLFRAGEGGGEAL